jgi:hypothetical protein
MSGEARKVSDWATVNAVANTDSVLLLADGNNALITVAGLRRIPIANTPANSTITSVGGDVFTDGSYLYVAVANNSLKRVALSTF